MALTINTNIRNDADGYSLDAKQVKGGYVAVLTKDEMAGLPSAIVDSGSLCLVLEDGKFYLRTVAGNWTELPASYLGLTDEQLNALASGVTIEKIKEYDEHLANSDIHVAAEEKTKWNNHTSDSDIHVTQEEKESWNGKLDADDLKVLTKTSESSAFEISDADENTVMKIDKNGHISTKSFDSSRLSDLAFSGDYGDLYNRPKEDFKVVGKSIKATAYSPKVIFNRLDQCLYVLQGKRHPVVCSDDLVCSETVYPMADPLDNDVLCSWGLICSDNLKVSEA